MTITLELKPEELTVLSERAQAQGVNIEAVVHGLIAHIVPAPAPEKPTLNEKQQAAIALMQTWRQEHRTDDPEELAERDRELEEFKANMNRWRAEGGRPPIYR